jgi:hypothetical protein
MRILAQAEQWPFRIARPYHPGYDDPDLWLTPAELAHYTDPSHFYSGPHYELKRNRFIEHHNHTLHPLVLSTDGTYAVINNGHHRVRAAADLGIDTLPVNVIHRDPEYFHQYAKPNRLIGDFLRWRSTHQPQGWGYGRPLWVNTATGTPDPATPNPPPGWQPKPPAAHKYGE